jgi:hypothetical protein
MRKEVCVEEKIVLKCFFSPKWNRLQKREQEADMQKLTAFVQIFHCLFYGDYRGYTDDKLKLAGTLARTKYGKVCV